MKSTKTILGSFLVGLVLSTVCAVAQFRFADVDYVRGSNTTVRVTNVTGVARYPTRFTVCLTNAADTSTAKVWRTCVGSTNFLGAITGGVGSIELTQRYWMTPMVETLQLQHTTNGSTFRIEWEK